ncbi:MAG: hypothetical protein PHC61_19030, partial [Chitinivibrionales bacterium]|nr:hypothetical protein [Chitinivibrionales bacterium]
VGSEGIAQVQSAPQIPKDVINANSTLFLTQKEVQRFNRHKTPFCILTLSIARINRAGQAHAISPGEKAWILPGVFAHLLKFFRDLDLVGMLGDTPEELLPFVVLPMTDENGGRIAKERLGKDLGAAAFKLQGETVTVTPVITVTPFQSHFGENLKTFIDVVQKNHRDSIEHFPTS